MASLAVVLFVICTCVAGAAGALQLPEPHGAPGDAHQHLQERCFTLVTSSSRLLLKGVLECLTESCGDTDHLVGGQGGDGAVVPSVQLQLQLSSCYMTQVPPQAGHLQPAGEGGCT